MQQQARAWTPHARLPCLPARLHGLNSRSTSCRSVAVTRSPLALHVRTQPEISALPVPPPPALQAVAAPTANLIDEAPIAAGGLPAAADGATVDEDAPPPDV